MAIGEKKALLRGMYNEKPGDPATAPEPTAPSMLQSSTGEKEIRVDRWIHRFAHAALYLLIAIDALVVAWTFRENYLAGYAFDPHFRVNIYIADTFRLAVVAVFLILLGLCIFILFREHLPRKARWLPFGLLVALLPIAITSGFFLPVAFRAGRAAALADLNFPQLESDADAVAALYNDHDLHTINPGDPDFAKVSSYLTDHFKAQTLQVSPAGVLIINDNGGGHFDESTAGVFVPATRLSSSAAATFANKHNMTPLGGTRPIFQFDESADLTTLTPPTTAPAWGR